MAKSDPKDPGLPLAQWEREALASPADVGAQLRWGWALYGSGEPARAATQARRAAGLDPSDPETHYLLGMALKAAGEKEAAVAAFRSAASGTAAVTEPSRSAMLRRLAVGQANWLEKGKWDLEPETWVRT